MKIQTGGIFLLVVLLVAPGCMLVVSHENHPDWDQKLSALGTGKETLPIRITCLGKPCGTGDATSSNFVQLVRDALKDGPFSISEGFSLRDDLVARISVGESNKQGPLLLPSLLTAFIIPCSATCTLGLEIDFTDREDKLFKRYTRKAKYDRWIGWAFFVWGMSASDLDVDYTLLLDMARDIVKEIYEKDYDVFKACGSRNRTAPR